MSSQKREKSSSWDDFPLSKEIKASLKANGLEEPLPIQVKSLKATLLGDKHVLGAAQTGSGKTLAYAIPLLNRILTNRDEYPSSKLKAKICKHQRKKEDFELIDGEMTAVEDMIVDKFSDEVQSSDEDSDTSSISDCELDSDDLDQPQYSCPEAVVLVPTRELALQVRDEIDKICSCTTVRTCCLIGGLSQEKQLRTLKKRPEIIIATPGRLYDIVQSDLAQHLNVQSIASIGTLVIDEADRMVQKGHFEEMVKIIDILKDSKKFRRDAFPYRVYLFSATLTFLHELPDRFRKNLVASKESRSTNTKKSKAKKIVDPKEHSKKNKIKQMLNLLGILRSETRIIDLNDQASFGRPSSDQLVELKINCLAQEKDLYLYYFLIQNVNKRTLVFCNSKDCLRRLSNVLKYLEVKTLTLHADMDQKKRLSSLDKFRQRNDTVLIATDVAARGLDIKDLDCVVHYQVPKTCESYIHRSGRTARLFKKGVSLTLCEPKEAPYYRRLCNNINGGKDIEDHEIDMNLKVLLKDRVNVAQQCDKLDHQLRETKSDRNWFLKAAKDCDIELDEDELRHLSGRGKTKDQNLQEDANKRRRLAQLQKQLKTLLKKSLITRESLMKSSMNKLQDV